MSLGETVNAIVSPGILPAALAMLLLSVAVVPCACAWHWICSGSARAPRSQRWALGVIQCNVLILWRSTLGPDRLPVMVTAQAVATSHFLCSSPLLPSSITASSQSPLGPGPWSFVLITTVWELFIRDIVTVHTCDRTQVPKVWAYQSHTTLHSWPYSEFIHSSRCLGIPPVGNLQHIEKGLACSRCSIKIN